MDEKVIENTLREIANWDYAPVYTKDEIIKYFTDITDRDIFDFVNHMEIKQNEKPTFTIKATDTDKYKTLIKYCILAVAVNWMGLYNTLSEIFMRKYNNFDYVDQWKFNDCIKYLIAKLPNTFDRQYTKYLTFVADQVNKYYTTTK